MGPKNRHKQAAVCTPLYHRYIEELMMMVGQCIDGTSAHIYCLGLLDENGKYRKDDMTGDSDELHYMSWMPFRPSDSTPFGPPATHVPSPTR